MSPRATSSCVAEISGWVRGDAAEIIFECFAGLACGENDDACASLVEPLAIHEEWEGRCRTAMATCVETPDQLDGLCEVSPSPTSDDIGIFRFIAPPIMEEIIDCMDAADCNARITCVQTVLDAHNVDL